MLIGDLARATGVSSQVVRFYVRSGLISAAERTDNGYRHFRNSDIQRIRFIRDAQALGVTLAKIRDILELPDAGTRTCCRYLTSSLAAKVRDINAEIARLESLAATIESVLDGWQPIGCGEENAVRCPKIEGAFGPSRSRRAAASETEHQSGACNPSGTSVRTHV